MLNMPYAATYAQCIPCFWGIWSVSSNVSIGCCGTFEAETTLDSSRRFPPMAVCNLAGGCDESAGDALGESSYAFILTLLWGHNNDGSHADTCFCLELKLGVSSWWLKLALSPCLPPL